MWRSVGGVLVLTAISLSGCLSDENLPVVADVPVMPFMDGDRLDWAFEGTGTFRAIIDPGEHVNLRFRIAHDAVDGWCSFNDGSPLYQEGAFTAVMMHQSDKDPNGSGAHLIRVGHNEDIQRTATSHMSRDDDCARSDLIGFGSASTITITFASSVPGMRLSVFDQHAPDEPAYQPIALAPFPTAPIHAPTPKQDGLAAEDQQRVQWTTEWRQEHQDLGPTLFVGLRWRDAQETSPLGDPADQSLYQDEIVLTRHHEGGSETVHEGGGGGRGGSAYDGASITRVWATEPGDYEFVWRHTETRTTTTPREQGAWFIAVPWSP